MQPWDDEQYTSSRSTCIAGGTVVPRDVVSAGGNCVWHGSTLPHRQPWVVAPLGRDRRKFGIETAGSMENWEWASQAGETSQASPIWTCVGLWAFPWSTGATRDDSR